MLLLENKKTNINQIIRNQRLVSYFQPIISIKKKNIIGFEALSRGIDKGTLEIIPPDILFDLAKNENLTVELDRLCRRKALENYSKIYSQNDDFVLFLNLDTSIIDEGVVGSGNIINLVNSLGINPGNVVIEIIESKVNDMQALSRFIENHKNYGFLIALDDVGSGHSNLERIPLCKPDILKTDRNLVSGIDKKYYKQEVLKSLVNLSKKIGALLVAEGVEKEEEAMCALELGADMLQGFYFSKPQENITDKVESLKDKTEKLATKFKNHMVKKFKTARLLHRGYSVIINNLISKLSNVSVDLFDDKLEDVIKRYPVLECVYVLNEKGIQVTDTFCSFKNTTKNNKIYGPAKKGDEHSIKDYYYFLISSGSDRYTSEPYISLASGNLCLTISSVFRDVDGNIFVLCIDVKKES